MVHCWLYDFGYWYSLYHAVAGVDERRVERAAQFLLRQSDKLLADERRAEQMKRERDSWWNVTMSAQCSNCGNMALEVKSDDYDVVCRCPNCRDWEQTIQLSGRR